MQDLLEHSLIIIISCVSNLLGVSLLAALKILYAYQCHASPVPINNPL